MKRGHCWRCSHHSVKAQEWRCHGERLRFAPDVRVRVREESPQRSYCWRCRQVAVKTAAFWRYQYHQTTIKDSRSWGRTALSLGNKWHTLWTAELEKGDCHGLRNLEVCESQESSTEHCPVGLWFCFDLIVTVPCFFSLGIRKVVSYFWFYGTPGVRLWRFREIFLL